MPNTPGQPPRTIAYEGSMFRLELQPVPHRTRPYEFVQRIGSALVLPITFDKAGSPLVVAIENDRHHYGKSVTLPGGYLEGGLDTPEDPLDAALRELYEETGYGFKPGEKPRVSLFSLRSASNVVVQDRYFAVMHGVSLIGEPRQSGHERVTIRATPLREYMEPLFGLAQKGMPELNLAFGKAAIELGRQAVIDWIANPTPQSTAAITNSFKPWMYSV